LDETPVAEAAARRLNKPVAHILHNDRQLQFHKVQKADLLIANSNWIAASIPDRLKSSPTEVLYPPTFLTGLDLIGDGRDAITLVNMLEAKGAGLFYDLAERLPDRQFLAVTGAYGQQVKPPDLPNLTVRPNRVDMEPVWAQTRLYLQPSSYESYGKAAVEAMAHRIPVLAHPTPGLLESLAAAGIFIDRDQPDSWAAAIKDLDNATHYRRAAGRALERAQELEAITISQLERVEVALEELNN
jgi:glycosyltransferase involved in cell wall biosynthesis